MWYKKNINILVNLDIYFTLYSKLNTQGLISLWFLLSVPIFIFVILFYYLYNQLTSFLRKIHFLLYSNLNRIKSDLKVNFRKGKKIEFERYIFEYNCENAFFINSIYSDFSNNEKVNESFLQEFKNDTIDFSKSKNFLHKMTENISNEIVKNN